MSPQVPENNNRDAELSSNSVGPASEKPRRRLFAWFNKLSMSAKLLLLTIAFVMIAEILIFVPSVANFRKNWLTERLAAAQIASLAAEAVPDKKLPDRLRNELLSKAGVHAVALRRVDTRRLLLQSDMPAKIDGHYDLRTDSSLKLVGDALAVFVSAPDRKIRVVGQPGFRGGVFIEIVVDEAPLKAAMFAFGWNILGLSIIISFITATLVYFSLRELLVKPMMRLTRNVVEFSKDPENPNRIIEPSGRTDEFGAAEHELATMQRQLAGMLQQKNHLAALGLAVSKINHDLRNMLANAQLISDRFGTIKNPTVQRFAPKLIASLDRAIRLCSDTLRYGRAQEMPPARERFAVKPMLQEVGESFGLPIPGRLNWTVDADDDLEIDADRDQLYRVLSNLCRNAVQVLELETRESGANTIKVRAWRNGANVIIEVSDTGPGLPAKARAHLFEAFKGAVRKGGTGLGLAISAELIRAHGGSIELVDTTRGATFRISMPDTAVDLSAERARRGLRKGSGPYSQLGS
ncbi:nitrogen regulation protein [bacterium MnTg02]|nr:nitrogen regulation protein [bacterium MnTg02]